MIDEHLFAEDTTQTLAKLRGECNFGHHEQGLPSLFDHLLNEMHVDLGLSARSDALQQANLMIAKRKADLPIGYSLHLGERMHRLALLFEIGIVTCVKSRDGFFEGRQQAFLMHFVEDGGADSSRFEEHILGHGVGLGLLKCVTHVEQLHEERLLLWGTLQGFESGFEARRGLNFRSSRSGRSGRSTLSIRRTRSNRR